MSCYRSWDSDWRWHRHYYRSHYRNIPWLFGLSAMFLLFRWFVPAMVLFAVGVAKTIGWLAHSAEQSPARRDSFDPRDTAPPASTTRVLSIEERAEMEAIKAYATALEKAGGDASLAQELRQQADQIVRDQVNVLAALKALRATLPPLSVAERDSFVARLQREVSLINKTDGELPRSE